MLVPRVRTLSTVSLIYLRSEFQIKQETMLIKYLLKFHSSSTACPLCSLWNCLTYAAYLSKHYSTMKKNHQNTASNDLHPSPGSKKPVRRRSFINWIFRRSPDYVRLDTPDPNPGHMFGKTLMDICEDGDLPGPVLVSIFSSSHFPPPSSGATVFPEPFKERTFRSYWFTDWSTRGKCILVCSTGLSKKITF